MFPSQPVNMYQPTSLGFHDVHGNVWEWNEDHFNGLDGFDTHFLYDDFSSPCFDGRHNLILVRITQNMMEYVCQRSNQCLLLLCKFICKDLISNKTLKNVTKFTEVVS